MNNQIIKRPSGRNNNQIREVWIIKNYIKNTDASCLISIGNTNVICSSG